MSEPEQELLEMHPQSYGWALHCCRWDPVEAEEVLQAAYLKVLSGRARFDGRSSFRTWFFSVIRNTAAGRRRSAARAATAVGRWILGRSGAPAAADPESRLAGSEMARILTEALDGLARRQREVLHLVFYQDLTLEEAARVMGVSVGSARVHYERGKKRLRHVLPVAVRG